jgi:hypothetical protein
MTSETAYEIQLVANGYLVRPASGPGTAFLWEDEVYVFETFDSLTEFLRTHLKVKNNER